jgi:hypothetical protein
MQLSQPPRGEGVILGGPRLSEARKLAHAANGANADQHAANVLPIIREVQKSGATTLRDRAQALNARGVHTAEVDNAGHFVKNCWRAEG